MNVSFAYSDDLFYIKKTKYENDFPNTQNPAVNILVSIMILDSMLCCALNHTE